MAMLAASGGLRECGALVLDRKPSTRLTAWRCPSKSACRLTDGAHAICLRGRCLPRAPVTAHQFYDHPICFQEETQKHIPPLWDLGTHSAASVIKDEHVGPTSLNAALPWPRSACRRRKARRKPALGTEALRESPRPGLAGKAGGRRAEVGSVFPSSNYGE